MKAYKHNCGADARLVRSHPWSVAENNPNQRYYDFKAEPSLVQSVLEDFVPWSDYPATQSFYDLVAWINSPHLRLESNDCAFKGVHKNSNPKFKEA